MILTKEQIADALRHTAETFNRNYTDATMRPSGYLRRDLQLFSGAEMEKPMRVISPLMFLRRMSGKNIESPMEEVLIAFYLAYGSKITEASAEVSQLAASDLRTVSYCGITPEESVTIYDTMNEIVEDKDMKYTWTVKGGGLVAHAWAWQMGQRFRQYVEDTEVIAGIAQNTEA